MLAYDLLEPEGDIFQPVVSTPYNAAVSPFVSFYALLFHPWFPVLDEVPGFVMICTFSQLIPQNT